MKKSIIIVLSALFLIGLNSCSPEKRLERLLKNHPSLVKSDTVSDTIAIQLPGTFHDSTFNFYQKDTVYLQKDNQVIKYYINKKDSTVYISGEVKPKTIYKIVPVIINTASITTTELTWWDKTRIWIFENGWWIALIAWAAWNIYKKWFVKKIFA